MTKRYRVFKIDNKYGVSDDIANYTLAWDTSKIIMDGLCDKLNEQDERIKELEDENQMMKDTILLCKKTIKEDLTYREMQDNLEMILWNVITDDRTI